MSERIPVVVIPGLGQNPVFSVDTQGNRTSCWPPSLDEDRMKKEFLGTLMKMTIFRKDVGFSDKVARLIAEFAAPFGADKDGNPREKLEFEPERCAPLSSFAPDKQSYIRRFVPLDGINDDDFYYFAHDMTGNPLVNAQRLHIFIGEVLSQSGCEKVRLLCIGLSAPIVTVYLDRYRDDTRLDRVVFFFAAPDGTLLMSDILSDSLDYSGFIAAAGQLGSNETLSMFTDMGKMIPGLAEKIAEKSFTAVRSEFLHLPYAWSLVPNDDYSDLRDMLLSDASPVLRETVDAYQKAASHLEENIRFLQQNGIGFYSLCGAGEGFLPLTLSVDVCSDGIVNTSSAALNPSIAESDDPASFAIDTQAGILPGSTWYFYKTPHMKAWKNETATRLCDRLLSEDGYDGTDIPFINKGHL